MRLIDVDEFKKFISELPNGENGYSQVYDKSSILDFIDDQPTAYDVDKVVERLEVNSMFAQVDDEPFVMLDDAVEIVKSGGIE